MAKPPAAGLDDASPAVAVHPSEVYARTLLAGRSRSICAPSSTHLRPGILLDRDFTIIVDHGYVGSVDRVEFIEGAPEAIARFNRASIPVTVVTNQSGVAHGLYGIDDVARVHRHIEACLARYWARIKLFLYCPYHPAGVVAAFARASEDRKPRPGMANIAAGALNLDLTSSWVVGDRPEDIGLAEAVRASAVYLGTGDYGRPDVWSCPSLAAAAAFILERIAYELYLQSPGRLRTSRRRRPGQVPDRIVRERGVVL